MDQRTKRLLETLKKHLEAPLYVIANDDGDVGVHYKRETAEKTIRRWQREGVNGIVAGPEGEVTTTLPGPVEQKLINRIDSVLRGE